MKPETSSISSHCSSRLTLTRTLIPGMDRDGVPLSESELPTPVYIKYNSGTRTFEEVRSNNGIVWYGAERVRRAAEHASTQAHHTDETHLTGSPATPF